MTKTRKPTRKGRDRKPRNVSLAPAPANRWDMGPETAAQSAGKVIEDATWFDELTGEKVNPNGVKRARRIDIVESYHKRRNPILDARQYSAAVALRNAFLSTQRSAPAIKAIQVDSSPKPDAHIAIMIDRQSKLHSISRHIPPECLPVIDMVVFEGHSIGHHPLYRALNFDKGKELLRRGLNAVADGLKL